VLVLELLGPIQGLGEPVLHLRDDAVYTAVELDARPAEATWIQARLFETVSEVVVVGLLATVLEEQPEPHGGAGEMTEHGAGVDGLGRAGGDSAALGVW
jgi:hypothetical protein